MKLTCGLLVLRITPRATMRGVPGFVPAKGARAGFAATNACVAASVLGCSSK